MGVVTVVRTVHDKCNYRIRTVVFFSSHLHTNEQTIDFVCAVTNVRVYRNSREQSILQYSSTKLWDRRVDNVHTMEVASTDGEGYNSGCYSGGSDGCKGGSGQRQNQQE